MKSFRATDLLTLIERPQDDPSSAVTFVWEADDRSDRYTRGSGLKWPKAVQWRGSSLDIGGGALAICNAGWWPSIGLNVRLHDINPARPRGKRHRTGLCANGPALRAAAGLTGPLSVAELSQWYDRDIARGRSCTEPARGKVMGIGADGSLMVMSESGNASFTTGSLVLEEA